jgi:hypothetical protein
VSPKRHGGTEAQGGNDVVDRPVVVLEPSEAFFRGAVQAISPYRTPARDDDVTG